MQVSLGSFVLELPIWLMFVMGIVMAFAITWVSIPAIVTVSKKIGLFEKTNGRGSHKGEIPTLGGVAIFAGLIITGSVFANREVASEFQYLLAAMFILFFAGIKDDLLVIDPYKKLIAQIVAAGVLIVLGDVRITTFHGFANVYEISYLLSVCFTVFVYIVIINGFNLIDGIDGLASGVGIVTSLSFGFWFVLQGDHTYAVVPFGLAGSLLAFFRYNVFSKKNKIFLGDTGSLIIGLVLAVIAINFLEYEQLAGARIPSTLPAMAFGILIVPLFDTLRVFVIRILGGESPFKADRKHIHHRIIDLGCSHLCATIIIITVNIFFIALVFLLESIGNLKLLILELVLASALSYLPVFLIFRRSLKVVSKTEKDSKVIPIDKKNKEAEKLVVNS